MSIHLIAQVWDLDLPPLHKFILLAYADDAFQWPPLKLNIPRLARKTGLSEVEVDAVMRALSANTTLLHTEAEP